jgi:hypothetical protein
LVNCKAAAAFFDPQKPGLRMMTSGVQNAAILESPN